MMRLVEWVGVNSPIGKDQAEANGFENACKGTNCDGVQRTLLGEDLRDKLYADQHLFVYRCRSANEGPQSKAIHTLGAELAMKIRLPMYAAPL